MPQRDTLIVRGYREFLRATDRAEKESKRFVRDNFRQVGEVVRGPAAEDLLGLQPKGTTAAGLRTIVRRTGVTVEQTLRKTTGKRPDWGVTQMRKVLLPELEQHERDIEQQLEKALDRVAEHFNR